jgi:hypothetical protein
MHENKRKGEGYMSKPVATQGALLQSASPLMSRSKIRNRNREMA